MIPILFWHQNLPSDVGNDLESINIFHETHITGNTDKNRFFSIFTYKYIIIGIFYLSFDLNQYNLL